MARSGQTNATNRSIRMPIRRGHLDEGHETGALIYVDKCLAFEVYSKKIKRRAFHPTSCTSCHSLQGQKIVHKEELNFSSVEIERGPGDLKDSQGDCDKAVKARRGRRNYSGEDRFRLCRPTRLQSFHDSKPPSTESPSPAAKGPACHCHSHHFFNRQTLNGLPTLL